MQQNRQEYLVSSPTRVDLAGGTLDLWPLYTLFNETRTINCAIDLFAQAKFHVEDSSNTEISISAENGANFSFNKPLTQEQILKVPPAVRFPVAIVSRYIEQKKEIPKVKLLIAVSTQAPLRSGLGGSSSLCVALTRGLSRAFNDFSGQNWRYEMLNWVKDFEAGFIKAPTGTQDYLAALFGGLKSFNYSTGTLSAEPYSDSVFTAFKDRLLILFSGEMHHSGLSNWEIYKGAMEGRGEILVGLKEVKRISDELNIALKSSAVDWKAVGRLISDEWEIRRTMFKVETPRLEEIVTFLKSQKILGVRVCGAASGGSLIVLTEPEAKAAVAAKCMAAKIQVLKAEPTQLGVAIS